MASAPPGTLLVGRPLPFARFLFGSAVVHAGLVSLAVAFGALMGKPAIDLNQNPIHATLVRQGTPRDEKLLPRKEELPPPPEEIKSQAPAPEPVEPKAVAPVPIAPPAPPRPKQAGVQDGAKKKLLGAFDQLSKSKSPPDTSGEANGDPNGDSAKAEGERYYGLLTSQVKRFYDVSDTIPDQERIRLTAQVALFIGSSGNLIRAKLSHPSGNDLFDGAVLGAVKRASPFAPPPPELRDALSKYGVVLQFRP